MINCGSEVCGAVGRMFVPALEVIFWGSTCVLLYWAVGDAVDYLRRNLKAKGEEE